MLDPAEVHGQINAMNNQKALPRRKSRDSFDLSPLPVLHQGIAREIAIVIRSNFERQVVYGITEFEEFYVGLNPQVEVRRGNTFQIFWLKRGFGSRVEALTEAPVPANNPANAAPVSIAFVVLVIFKFSR
jgi:hypothetical protein